MSSYRTAVAEAKRLVRRTHEDQWRLAELTWEQVAQRGYTTQQWAKDIGVSQDYVQRLVQLEAQYHGTPIMSRPRFWDEVWGARGINSVAALQRAPAHKRAEVVSDLLNDPEVAEAPTVRRATRRADERRTQRQLAEAGLDREPETYTSDLIVEATSIALRADGLRHDVEDLLRRAEADQRPRLVSKIEPRVRRVLDALDLGSLEVPDDLSTLNQRG